MIALLLGAVACGGATDAGLGSDDAGARNDGAPPANPTPIVEDAAVPAPPEDAGGGAPADGGSSPTPNDGSVPPSNGDGPPTRRACTSSFGSALSTSHGRLDGYVVAVIAPGQSKQCNGDSSHVHIQILVGSAVYDVAANVDGGEYEHDGALVGGAWAEGWHTQASLDYASNLGVHSTEFTLTGIPPVAAEVEQRLAQANHVSIFCTGYGPTGCHLVHRQRGGRDGAIVLDPLSANPHWLLFDFPTDTF